MDYETVYPSEQDCISGGLQIPGRRAKAWPTREGLRGREVLAINVSNGGGLLQIVEVHRLDLAWPLNQPHRSHRYIGRLFHLHAFTHCGVNRFVRFAVTNDADVMKHRGELVVMIRLQQLLQSPAPIPQKSVAALRRFNNITSERGQPRRGVIPAQTL